MNAWQRESRVHSVFLKGCRVGCGWECGRLLLDQLFDENPDPIADCCPDRAGPSFPQASILAAVKFVKTSLAEPFLKLNAVTRHLSTLPVHWRVPVLYHSPTGREKCIIRKGSRPWVQQGEGALNGF